MIRTRVGLSTTLAGSDSEVRKFEQQLADVSSYLAGEKDNLAAVKQLSGTLYSVRDFVQQNRGRLKSNVDKLAGITQMLVDQRSQLAEILDIAPLALGNLNNTYNASLGTLDGRANLNQLTQPPLLMICNFLKQTPEQLDAVGDLCKSVQPLLGKAVDLPSLAEAKVAMDNGHLPPLPLPVVNQLIPGGGQ